MGIKPEESTSDGEVLDRCTVVLSFFLFFPLRFLFYRYYPQTHMGKHQTGGRRRNQFTRQWQEGCMMNHSVPFVFELFKCLG